MLLPLAVGFEEIEAVTIVDVLRRGGVEVVVASVGEAGVVEGAHGIGVRSTVGLDEVAGEEFDMIVLPGGEPGTTNLAADERLAELLRRSIGDGKPVGAICAAPRILAAGGYLEGRVATSHPSVEAVLRDAGARYATDRVVQDGKILTSRGPGTALEFALAVLDHLGLVERAHELRQAMLTPTPA